MEKTNKRVGKNEGGTQLRSGRVALGEITNVVTRDRRKPCAVKRVVVNQVKCSKRKVNSVGSATAVKRSKRSSLKSIPTTGKLNQVQDIENIAPESSRSDIITIKESHESKMSYNDSLTDTERTTSCEIKRKPRTENLRDSLACNTSEIFMQYDQEIYEYLLKQEREQLLKPNHLQDRNITYKMRQMVIDWLFEVQIHFRLSQESIELTVTIMDRCLEKDPTINQDNVQLVCLSAMFIAIKYEETFLLELSDLRYVCDYSYQESEILEMERKVLRIIDCSLGFALITNFSSIYLQSLQKNHTIEKLVKYYVDLSLLDYKLASVEPSRIASAALYISLCVFQGSIQQSMSNITIYSILDLQHIIVVLSVRALSYTTVEKGGVFNKHLRESKPGSLKDILQTEVYSHTLKQICAMLQ